MTPGYESCSWQGQLSLWVTPSLPLSYRCWLPSSVVLPVSWLVLCWQCCCWPLELWAGFRYTRKENKEKKYIREITSCQMCGFTITGRSQKNDCSQARLLQPSTSPIQHCVGAGRPERWGLLFFLPISPPSILSSRGIIKSAKTNCHMKKASYQIYLNLWNLLQKGTTEDEMVGWHHRLNGHEFEQAPGVGDGQGSLACCSPWGRKESDMTERLNWIYEINLRNKFMK